MSGCILKSYGEILKDLDPKVRNILDKIPKKGFQRLPSEWLHWQILERFKILEYAQILEGSNILEIGCGSHAMATIPLAALVGEKGSVVALDLGRWGNFCEYLMQSGLSLRVLPIQVDARETSFPCSCFDLVTCIHGVRSFDSRESVVKAVKEMLRVTKNRIFIVESSPFVKTKAQKAHIAMYNLRHPTFTALGRGHLGDLHYFTPEELQNIVLEAGASKVGLQIVDVDMPHHLAYFPFDEIKQIKNHIIREDLERKWRAALEMLDTYGEEHPPVIVITAWK
uniref:Putative menaquione biosynthesis methyltransferase n=1 Tax=uncultured marine crenarchaeote E37-7F TaxID=907717 RepID=G9BAQ1_9ARCH|nr:putative menaquione biosynthesis methyltransferase [uncultured marine crenarchaeote E37-7F]